MFEKLTHTTVLVQANSAEQNGILGHTPSGPWWNHDFLSDDIYMEDSGDFDDG
jgi:hypothetical protein